MTNDQRRPTAKILEFPRDRLAAIREARSRASDSRSAAEPRVDFGAWYHEAAIEEGERSRKR
jgi:hypothetical protein